MLTRPEVLSAAIGARLESDAENAPMLVEQIGRTHTKLEKVLVAWDEARRLRYAGEVGDAEFARDKQHFAEEIETLQGELDRLEATQAEHQREGNLLERVQEVAERWQAVRAELTASEKAQIIWTLVSDVAIDREDYIVITGSFGEPDGLNRFSNGGRYWIRTSDLCDVNAAL